MVPFESLGTVSYSPSIVTGSIIVSFWRQDIENLYSPHNSDSISDKINTKLYNKNTKK